MIGFFSGISMVSIESVVTYSKFSASKFPVAAAQCFCQDGFWASPRLIWAYIASTNSMFVSDSKAVSSLAESDDPQAVKKANTASQTVRYGSFNTFIGKN